MKDFRRPGPTNVFALADGDLFAAFTCVRCIVPGENRLKLLLEKMPKKIPGPNWLNQIQVRVDDPGRPFLAFAYVESAETVNGELCLTTETFRDIPLSEATAKKLSKDAMLLLESPFGKKRVLNFHALLRAKRKNTSTP